MSEQRLDTEFSWLVRCCRWNFASEAEQAALEIPSGLNWSRLVSLARRHRVQGLAWNALAKQPDRLPDPAKEALSSDARRIAATNLGIAAECRELRVAFEHSNVPLLFIKGLTVGALAYRAPILKMGWDIDLLIDPRDLDGAAALLSSHGYALALPTSLAKLSSWHRRSKESVWHRDGSLHIELHTRLPDNERLIPTVDIRSPRQLVQVMPGLSLPTLAEEELFAYLAIHGASSAWFRLKWISDFAALIHERAGEDIDRLYRRSQDLGAARAAGQALLLADRLFATLEPVPSLREELARDRATRLLSSAALRVMTSGTSEPTERPLGTFAIHWTQLLLKPGLDFKFSELARQGGSLLNRLPR